MILLGVLASIVGTAVVLLMDWFPEDASSAAGPIDLLYDVLLIFSVPIFVLVMAIAIYSVIKFRARPGDMGDGAPIHGNTRLEVFWVTIPFLIVSGLAVYGWIVLDDIEAKEPNALVVNVTGQQFTWDFEYPAQKIRSSELVLPKDRPVNFQITRQGRDPLLLGARVPAQVGRRAGPDHRDAHDAQQGRRVERGLRRAVRPRPSTMRQEVAVLEPGRWQAWVGRQRRAPDKIGNKQQ